MNNDSQFGVESRNVLGSNSNEGDYGTMLQRLQQPPGGDSPPSTVNNGLSADFANEMKRLQQLNPTNTPSVPTALLPNMNSNFQYDQSTVAFIQQMFESQQQRGNSFRFDIPLATSMGLSHGTFGQVIGSSGVPTSNDVSNLGHELFISDRNISDVNQIQQFQNSFLTDAHFLMAQQAVGVMNLPSFSNPISLQPQTQPVEQDGNMELPLPSPHSIFHRDGSKRMRGGVIEPFPVCAMESRRYFDICCIALTICSFFSFYRKNCIVSLLR
jgi:hypothetical protein